MSAMKSPPGSRSRRLAWLFSLSAAPVVFLTGCLPAQTAELTAGSGSRQQFDARSQPALSLALARQGFTTHLLVKTKSSDPVPKPPAGIELIHYRAPLGSYPAYVAAGNGRSGRHPAIVWIAGGFDNSIGDTPWAPATPDNDQSARAFPQAGILTMYPSLRGGNGNPGYNETLYGEVDDVIAAARHLATRPDVDSRRIYLGGHSTGGTLATLTAESTGLFRAVFAFGPVTSVGQYGKSNLTFDYNDRRELLLRAPILYLNAVTSPTFVFEGTVEPCNLDPLQKMSANCHNPRLRFYELPGLSHFSELAPITPVIAAQIVADTGAEPHFTFESGHPEIVPAHS
jgi:acetyl esterase/lipase